MTATDIISPRSTMREVLEAFPGAQRALFRRYHIGGCSSCGFQPEETLAQVCQRNGGLDVDEALEHIKTSHEQDAKVFVSPKELADWLTQDANCGDLREITAPIDPNANADRLRELAGIVFGR